MNLNRDEIRCFGAKRDPGKGGQWRDFYVRQRERKEEVNLLSSIHGISLVRVR